MRALGSAPGPRLPPPTWLCATAVSQPGALPTKGFTEEQAQQQFGFLLGAFEYGPPPHGGIAFGLDRLCTIIGGGETIRDYIAFPKNNTGRDVMIESPSEIDAKQLDELNIFTHKHLKDKGYTKAGAA